MDTTVEEAAGPGGPEDPVGAEAGTDPGTGDADDDGGLLVRFWAVVVAGVLGGVGLLVAGLTSVVVFLALAVAGVELSVAGRVLVGLVTAQGVSFPVVALSYLGARRLLDGYLDRPTVDVREYVGLRVPDLRDAATVVGAYLLVIVLVAAIAVAISSTGAPTAERQDQASFQDPTALVLLIVASFLLIGPGEELLFRGVIQSRLRERFSAPAAILLASATFAPLHVTALAGSPAALAVTVGVLFVPSLVFGAAYELTGNLLVPSLVHGAYNATIFGLTLLALCAGSTGCLPA